MRANKTHCKLSKDNILREEIEIKLKNKEEDWSPDGIV